MANQKESKILQLPAEIIHRIQSFLNAGEAARTCTLFKSWYDAWSTRPNLDFNFSQRSNAESFELSVKSFSDFTAKTMQKYKDSNLRIKTFRLQIGRHQFSPADNKFVKELIEKAVKLGAADLEIRVNHSSFVLLEPVVGAKTLVRLSLTRCKIDLWRNAEVITCSKLKYLHLSDVSNCFFDAAFMSKFPCLEELVIRHCFSIKDVRICSRSLERITLVQNDIEMAVFDVPNIRRFNFEEWHRLDLPHIKRFHFETTSDRGWEAEIRILCCQLNGLWFVSLNQLLEELSSASRVSLSVQLVGLDEGRDAYRPNPLPLHGVVENLTLSDDEYRCTRSLTLAFLDCIFLSCRPKLITVEWSERNHDLLGLLCTRLVIVDETDDDYCIHPNKGMVGLQDLEGVKVEVCEGRNIGVWRDFPWKTFMAGLQDSSMAGLQDLEEEFEEEEEEEEEEERNNGVWWDLPWKVLSLHKHYKGTVRFQLRWRLEPN